MKNSCATELGTSSGPYSLDTPEFEECLLCGQVSWAVSRTSWKYGYAISFELIHNFSRWW